METPGALEVARIPGVVTSVVSTCVYTSVAKCVLRRTNSAGERRGVVMSATPGMSETPCVEAAPCVSGVVTSVPECVLPSTPCVKGAPQVEGAACAPETARLCEPPCVSETPRVSAPACVGSMVCVNEAR